MQPVLKQEVYVQQTNYQTMQTENTANMVQANVN